jgi:hypothetical protein
MNAYRESTGGMMMTGENEVLGEKIYTESMVDERMGGEHWRNDTDTGNLSTERKTCPIDTLPTSNLTWTDLE